MDRLWDLGVMVRRKTLVGDDRGDLDAAIRETTARADLVVMSGGMGPTEDDLTSECVAAVLGVPLELHEPSLRAIEERFRRFGRTMTPNNEKQARFPRGAEVVPNRFGTAPGFAVRIGRAEVVCLPGVPLEYRGLAEEWLLPRIAAGLGEVPAGRVREAVRRPGVARRSRDAPGHGRSRERRRPLRLPRPLAGDPREVDGVRRPTPRRTPTGSREAVRAIFGDEVFGEGKEELPQLVVARLAARAERVAVAESCTGGLLAELVTRVPGASAVLDLGVVVYANAMKEAVLGVPGDVLAAHGAVSEPVARALAEGARRAGRATWGLGVTGIAGPTGGTPEKPVGTVHLALAGPAGTSALQRLYRGDRERIRRSAAYEALNLLRLAMR